jgi:hypothetical protein
MKLDKFLGEGAVGVISDGVPSVAPALAQEDPVALAWAGLWPESLKHLSASSMGLFGRCPEAWRNRYILGRKEPPAAAALVGSVFHDTLAYNYEAKIISHEDKPLAEMVEYLHDAAWPGALERNGGESEIQWRDEAPEDTRADAERATVAYYQRVVPRIQPVSAEREHRLHLPGLPVPVLGYTDLVTDEGIVVDTKTGGKTVSKPKAGWILQAGVYGLMVPGAPVHFHSVSRAKTPGIKTPLESSDLSLPWSERKDRNTKSIIVSVAAQIQFLLERFGPDETWPLTGTLHEWACDWCGYRAGCPAWAD